MQHERDEQLEQRRKRLRQYQQRRRAQLRQVTVVCAQEVQPVQRKRQAGQGNAELRGAANRPHDVGLSDQAPQTRASGVAKDIFAADHYERNRGHYLQMGKQLAEMLLAAQNPKQHCPSWQSEMGVVVDITGGYQTQGFETQSDTPRPREPPATSSAASAKRSAESGADKRSSKDDVHEGGNRQTDVRSSKTPSAARGKRPAESGVHKRSFACRLCSTILTSRRSLKDHVYLAHKHWRRQTRSRASETTTTGSSATAPLTEDAPEPGTSAAPLVIADSDPEV